MKNKKIESLPCIRELKDQFQTNDKIKLFDAKIVLTNGVFPKDILSILEKSPKDFIELNPDKTKKIFCLANLSHEQRKTVVKQKLPIPEVENTIKENFYICTHHLGQNGRLFSPISRTMTCTDTPHITFKDKKILKIRMITPIEAERLMSWPDNWTKYGRKIDGTIYEMSNKKRYKFCGNGIVSNVSKNFVENLIPKGKVLSLCSGVDGSCLALDKSRFELVGFCENDPHASDVLRYHHPNVPNFNDLKELKTNLLPEFNIIFASLPCQAFSVAGKRQGLNDTRGTLFYDMARILKDKQPEFFVFENVKGILSHDNGKTLKIILESFCELGYEIDFEILNSKNFGIPQTRERFFLFGRKIK